VYSSGVKRHGAEEKEMKNKANGFNDNENGGGSNEEMTLGENILQILSSQPGVKRLKWRNDDKHGVKTSAVFSWPRSMAYVGGS
jgi:hypothetical protein